MYNNNNNNICHCRSQTCLPYFNTSFIANPAGIAEWKLIVTSDGTLLLIPVLYSNWRQWVNQSFG